jgi:protein O-mannosyl-transferase
MKSTKSRPCGPFAPIITPLPTDSGFRHRLCVLIILAAGLSAYCNSFSGVFLFDDVHAIVENPCIRSLWPLTQAMSAPPEATVAGRPMVSLSLAVNYALGGLNPRGYHAFNLIVHLLCGLLLFGIVRRTLSSGRLQDRYGRAAPVLAVIIATLWVVHPLQTESVTYVIQRTETMMGLFYLLTLYCFLRAVASRQPVGWQIAAVGSCALGMTCKEVMVSAPLVVLLYDRIFVAGSFREIASRRRGLYLGLAATWIILTMLLATGPRSASVGFSHGISAFDYAKNQCIAIITYLKLAFWPHPLLLDYGAPEAVSLKQAAPYAVVLAALLIATVIALACRPRVGFMAACFFIILAPTSSFVPITTEVAAERRMYLPLAAVIVLVVLGVYDLIAALVVRNAPRSRSLWSAASCAAIVVACVLGSLTYQRNSDYHAELQIWSESLSVKPNNPRTHLSIGKALVEREQVDEGIRYYRRALQLDPDLVDAHFNLGNALQQKEQFEEAVAEYNAALRISPGYARVQMNLGVALVKLKRFQDAVALYEAMLRDAPDSAEIQGNLAVALVYAGQIDDAITHLRAATRLEPNDAVTRRNLAGLLLQQGRPEEAAREFREALRINPNDAQLQAGLNAALARTANAPQG